MSHIDANPNGSETLSAIEHIGTISAHIARTLMSLNQMDIPAEYSTIFNVLMKDKVTIDELDSFRSYYEAIRDSAAVAARFNQQSDPGSVKISSHGGLLPTRWLHQEV